MSTTRTLIARSLHHSSVASLLFAGVLFFALLIPLQNVSAAALTGAPSYAGGSRGLWCAVYQWQDIANFGTFYYSTVCEKNGLNALPAQLTDANSGNVYARLWPADQWGNFLGSNMTYFQFAAMMYVPYDSLTGNPVGLTLDPAWNIPGGCPVGVTCIQWPRLKESVCAPGKAMTGVRFFEIADAVDEEFVEAQCDTVLDETLGVSFWVSAPNAFNAITGYKDVACPAGQVATGVRLFGVYPNVDDEHVDVRCTTLTGAWLGASLTAVAPNAFATLPAPAGGYKNAPCAAGYVANGIRWYQIPTGFDEEHVDVNCTRLLPSTPTGFGAGTSACGNNWLNLYWNAVVGATSYTVKEGARVVYSGPALAVSDTGLALGSTHNYTIYATNAAGNSVVANATGVVANSCGPLGVVVNPVAQITLPTTAFTLTYTLTNGTPADTDCYLVAFDMVTMLATDLACSGSFAWNTPAGPPGGYGYYVRAIKGAENVLSSPVTIVQLNGAACPPSTIASCVLPGAPSGASVGSCAVGYSGTCNYLCSNSIWNAVDNSCAVIPPPPAPSMPSDFTVSSGAAWSVTMNANGPAVDCEFTRTSATYGDIPTASVGLSFTATAVPGAFVGPGTLRYEARCKDVYGQWSPTSGTTVTVKDPVPTMTLDTLNFLDFLNVFVNTTKNKTFTIENTGEAGSNLSGVVSTADPRFVCTLGCAYNLNVGDAPHTVTMTFKPTALGGPQSTSVLFDGAATPVLIATGFGAPVTISVPSAINFGSVPISRSKDIKFIIKNISGANLGLSTFSGYSGVYTCVSAATCAANGIDLAPGVENTVTLRFTPTAPAMAYPRQFGQLSGQPLYTISIDGRGVNPVFEVKEQ